MASFAESIALLTNPTPKVLDPEDDVNSETVAKISETLGNDEPIYEVSKLRAKTAPLLEDIDPKYAGRKVSRRSLNILKDESDEDGKTNSEIDEDVSEDDFEAGDLSSFKELIKQTPTLSDEEESEDDDDDDDGASAEGSIENEKSEESGISDEDTTNNVDVSTEVDKGKAIKAQQKLWNRLCETRIKLQKLLIIANKLPQFDLWENLKQKGGESLTDILNKSCNSVKHLLNNSLDLQAELLDRNPEISTVETESNENVAESDEEILSESDVEVEQNQTNITHKKTMKRKRSKEDVGDLLSKRHNSIIPYRNSVIQKWDEKVRLSTGRMTQKSFMAFDNSALKQIEQILQDKNRLIKRTQLKRSLYRVLGKQDSTSMNTEENNQVSEENNDSVSKQDMLLKDYDAEIFDDDDFYRQMLKDVIETKSVGIDPAVLRKQMEIQKIRNKMKRKVDTKASKGRKLRYDVHPKLLNFMAPIQTSTISDEARENLLKCLFAKNSV